MAIDLDVPVLNHIFFSIALLQTDRPWQSHGHPLNRADFVNQLHFLYLVLVAGQVPRVSGVNN
jgi:hypothetical protein